jgi:hypothetical protein
MSDSDGSNRRHPQSTFSTEYPYNQATITRSGHEIHINDAPGNESLRVAHTAGTYVEIEKSGRWVHTVVEKVYNYFKGTLTQTVDSHADIKIGGTYALNIDKSSYENVRGKKFTAVGDDMVDGVGGVREVHTERDKTESINGSCTTAIRGDMNTEIEGACSTDVKGTRTDVLNDDWFVTGKNAEISMTGLFKVKCKTMEIDASDTVEIRAGSSITITTAGGPITVTAQGVVYINGTQVRLND